ncbi:hypothetical protein BD414DRAFT_373801, partial [Trametes punicea]
EKEVPLAMLALAATALHASISEWRSGVYKPAAFSGDCYLDAYQEHILLLKGIQDQNPRAYHVMMHKLYKDASGLVPAMTLAGNAHSDALSHVDIAGMDIE